MITGLRVKPCSYARAVTEDVDGVADEKLSDSVDLSSVPRRNKDTPAIITRFVSCKLKSELLKQGKKLRGSDVYINEHLTKRNADIARNPVIEEARKDPGYMDLELQDIH